MDDKWSELIPLADALDYAGISGRLDKWERYVTWGLVRRPETIPGTNRVGITRGRAERLKWLLAVDSALPGRSTKSKLAFWIAFKGAEILRPDFAAEYVDAGIRQFFSSLRREIKRFLPGYDFHNLRAGPQTKKLGQRLAQFALQQASGLQFSEVHRQFFQQWLSQLFTIISETIFTDVPKRSLALRLRPVADPMFTDPTMARQFADGLASFLIEYGAEFRDPHTGPNRTLQTLREVSQHDPSAVLIGIKAANSFAKRVETQIMSEKAAHIPTATVKPYLERDWGRFFYSAVALIAGLMTRMWVNPNYNSFFEKLFGGKRLAIEDMVDELIDAYPRPPGV